MRMFKHMFLCTKNEIYFEFNKISLHLHLGDFLDNYEYLFQILGDIRGYDCVVHYGDTAVLPGKEFGTF